MRESFDLLIRHGRCVLPDGLVDCDIAIAGGRIRRIGALAGVAAAETVEARGLHVLPGLIDTQVHFREPGLEHKEDLESGTRGAVLGGLVGVFEMPNTKPGTTTKAAIEDKFARVRGRAWCDHAFYVGATAENVEQLPTLERLPGVAGVKVFIGSSTGDLLVADDPTIERVLRHGTRRIAFHCEDEERLRERRKIAEDAADPSAHPLWRDVESALRATRRVVGLARKTGRRVHILHVTTAEEMDFLAEHKDIASVEVLPQHLTLVAPECYERLGTYAQMNPPIREARHREALWQALREGIVDVLGSDHAPHTREEKAKIYPASPSGLTGVQTILPLMLDHVHAGRLTLQRLVDLLAAGPARLFGLAGKGRIAVGMDGDLTLVDLAAKRTIAHGQMASKSGWTPFDGMTVSGWPVATVIRGHVVMKDGALFGPPLGRPIRFQDCLPA